MDASTQEGTIDRKHWDITNKILHAFYKRVYHSLGYGFLEVTAQPDSAFSTCQNRTSQRQ
ncbi:MAG TPA: hypothetical protein VM537_15200 [Anaerolineae bacterium]|nr:hypothetical protein [Anaerolineae bacterium]